MAKKKKSAKKSVTVAEAPKFGSQWDHGAIGRANRIGLEIEDAAGYDPETGRAANPNGVKRMRRVDMIEIWRREGVISTAGYNAAEKLRDAWEATQQSPGWPDNDRVQSSARPDVAVTVQIDRLSVYDRLARHIPAADMPIITACVLQPYTPASAGYRSERYKLGLAHLRDALDRLSIWT